MAWSPPSHPPAVRAAAWRAGFLAWKLDSNQLRTYWQIRKRMAQPFARYVLNWPRRTGKTSLLLVIAVEVALQKRRSRVNVAASTKESLREIVWPILDWIFEDCPASLRPKFDERRGRVVFRNGSVIVLASCDNKRTVERLRGTKADLNIVEEGGTIPSDPGLRYVMTAVLNPQLLTTGGPTLMALTPPKSPGHEAVAYALQAKANGNYSHCRPEDNPRITPEQREAYLRADAEALGMSVEEYIQSPDYRREWGAEFLTDPELAVLPGFDEAAEAAIVRPLERSPLFVDRYVFVDTGWAPDFTGVLFAVWDFERQVLVFQHELLVRRMGTTALSDEIKRSEAALWGVRATLSDGTAVPAANVAHIAQREVTVFKRVGDMVGELIHDFQADHGLLFEQTAKDDRDAAIAAADRWVRQRKVQVVPYDPATGLGCKHLPVQMRLAIHNKHRTDFERTPEHGHFDLVAAKIYGVRNVRKHAPSRIPEGWGYDKARDHRQQSARPGYAPTLANMLGGGAK